LPLITALGLSSRFSRGKQDSNEDAPKLDHADQLIFCVLDSTKIKPSQFIRHSQRLLTKRQDFSKIPMFQFLLCCHASFPVLF
jgi:hypothetical protein